MSSYVDGILAGMFSGVDKCDLVAADQAVPLAGRLFKGCYLDVMHMHLFFMPFQSGIPFASPFGMERRMAKPQMINSDEHNTHLFINFYG